MIRKPQYVIVGLLCWACGGFQSCSAQAQSLGDKPAPSHLTLKSKNILDDLASLASLPKPEWRFHAGDLNHGESPLLDDTSWPVAKTPSTLPAESTWLRSKIKVPKTLNGYDLTGTQIRFQLQLDANGPITEIVYFDGRRVAMGQDLEPIVLFEDAHPGDEVLVAVKLLQQNEVRKFGGSEHTIQFSTTRPNPEDFREQAVSASLLLPALGADSSERSHTLQAAIESVDTAALSSADQRAFDESLRQAESELLTLRPLLQQAKIHLTGNSHIDAAWLWPWTETVEVVRQTFGTALQLMNEYPKYTYSQSAAAYDEWIEQKYPLEFQEIQRRVKEGRWEMVGGMWIEPDLNMPDGESLVRQLLIGKRYIKSRFGVDVRVGWNPDSFGYNWQLPQIYKRSGIDYFVTQKMDWNDTNPLPLKLFWWQSPDGSRVLTYFPHDYANHIEAIDMARAFAHASEANRGTTELLHLYGVGDHGGGPTRAMLDAGDRWLEPDKAYARLNYGNALSFFSDVENKLDNVHAPVWDYRTLAAGNTELPKPTAGLWSLPVWNDELYLEFHRGVFTTQANHKHNMRESEEWMLNAEKWSSIAWLRGMDYPTSQLNDAWKKVLFNQFHDLAAGSGSEVVYADAQKDYDSVRLSTDAAMIRASNTIVSYINTQSEKGVPIVVFNSLGWKRTDFVDLRVQLPKAASAVEILDSAGLVLPAESKLINSDTHTFSVRLLVPNIPSLGYELVYARAAKPRPAHTSGVLVSADGYTLENQFLIVTIDPKNGCITSLVNKKSKFNAIASGGCGNLLQAFVDVPKDYEAWNIDADFDKVYTNLDMIDSVHLIQHNALRAVLRITRHWNASTFVQEITLYSGIPRVDVITDIDWHERHKLLKVGFPLAASSPNATFEIPYGSIERPTTRNNSFEEAKFEVPALRWADISDQKNGFSLINDSKYGYDAKGNTLRLSLLRSPTWPDAEADQGHQHFSYALYPHAGTWKQALTIRRGYEFNYHLTAQQVQPHAGSLPSSCSFLGQDSNNVIVTALKKTEDGDGLVVRFFEWEGKPGNIVLTLPSGILSAALANLMEKPEGSPLNVSDSRHVTVPVTPFEIQTVLVQYDRPRVASPVY